MDRFLIDIGRRDYRPVRQVMQKHVNAAAKKQLGPEAWAMLAKYIAPIG
jgi:hypothetical protein